MEKDSAAKTPATGRRPLWRKLLVLALVLAGLVGAYAWAGFQLVPKLITSNAGDYVREHYGRELTLRDVQFNPFTLELRAGAMSLPDQDGARMISFEQLYVNIALWRSIGRRAVTFQDIVLTSPRVDLVHRSDESWNVADLLPPEPPEPPPEDEPPPRLVIDHFQVHAGAGSYTDRTESPVITEQLHAVDFTLRDFSTLLAGNSFDLTASSPNIESIRWQGSFGISPLSSTGQLQIGGFDLVKFMRQWLPEVEPFLDSGTGQFDARYEFALPKGPLVFKAQIGTFSIADLALRARGTQESWVKVPAVALSDIALDVAAQQLKISQLTLERAAITAHLDQEANLNLLAYLPPEEPATAGAPVPSGTAADDDDWTVGIGEIRVSSAEAEFTSLAFSKQPMHWRLAPVDLSVKGFASPAGPPLALEATAAVDESGKLALKGSHDPQSGITSLDVNASGLELATLQPAFDEQTQVSIRRGAAGAQGKLVVGGPEELRFTGVATVANLQVADRLNGTDLVRWRMLRVTDFDTRLEPLRVSARDVLLQSPYAQLVIEANGTTNLGVALSPPGTMPPANVPVDEEAKPATKAKKTPAKPARGKSRGKQAAPPPPPPPARAMPVEIRQVRITNGSMNFTDRTLRPQFSTGILEMNGRITGLSGKPGSVADVNIDGKVDRYAPVEIRGKVNYFAAQTLTDITMSFSNMEMTTFSPYSGKFAGYQIEKGKLNLETNYRIVDTKLDARHHIVIDQLQLGEKVESEDAVGLPLKLAVALLKDRNGVIDLDLPITGSTDDPQFRIGPIVWKMFKNLLVKIVSSPFTFIGGLFGGDGEDMQFIDFEPGLAALDERDTAKLDNLRKAMVDRPGINVDIPMVYDPQRDGAALRAVKWQGLIDKAAAQRYGQKAQQPGFVAGLAGEPKEQRKLMVSAYRLQFGKEPQWPKPDRKDPAQKDLDPDAFAADWIEQQLRPAVSVSDDDLQALGKARADAIQDVLLRDGSVEPGRVFVILQDDKPAARPAAAESPPSSPSGPGAEAPAAGEAPAAESPAASAPAAAAPPADVIRAELTLK